MYDKSGVGFMAPPSGSALAGGGGLDVLSSVGGMMSGLGPLGIAAGAAGGMFGDEGQMSVDIAKSESSGQFTSGAFSVGDSDSNMLIIAAIVLGLLIVFWRKK